MKRNSMAQALSQAAGHTYSRFPQVDAVIPRVEAAEHHALPTRTAVPPSRVGKKPVTGFFEPAVSRQLKRIGLDQEKSMQDLIQEALNDLFRKYDLPPIA